MKVRCVPVAFVCAVLFAGVAASPVAAEALNQPAMTLTQTGYEALAKGEAAKAIPYFSQAIESRELEPEALANAFFNRGLAYHQLGKAATAIDDYTAALSLDAMTSHLRAKVLYNRGLAQELAAHSTLAIEDYTNALLVDPTFSHAYYARANALAANGQNLFAVSDYERALKYHYPEAGKVYLGEAQTFERLKRTSDAAQLYRRALIADPNLNEASNRLKALGQVAEANDVVADPIMTAAISASPSGKAEIVGSTLPAPVAPPDSLAGQQVANNATANDDDDTTVATQPAPRAAKSTGNEVLLSSVPAIPTPVAKKPAPVQAVAAAPAPPQPKAVPQAPAAEPLNSGWTVQITSAASEDLAWGMWKKIIAAHKNLASEKPVVVKADLGAKGIFYRLRLQGFDSQQEAQSSCGKLKASGLSCFAAKAEG